MRFFTIVFMLLASFAAATTLDPGTDNTPADISVEGSSVSGGKTSTIRPFLESITEPSVDAGNLRAADKIKEFSVQEEASQHLEIGDRNLQQQGATVTLVNNCGYNAHLEVYYTSENLTYGPGFYYVTGNGGTFTLAHQVTDPNLHVYGFNATTGDTVWGATSSEYCFAQNDCFVPINIGSLASGSVTYNFCGANNSMSDRDTQWLDEHNSRRKTYYNDTELSDLPLKWSTSIARSAKAYGRLLLESDDACRIEHGYNGDDYGGENLASNWGSQGSKARTPSEVLTSWFDNEINLPDLFHKLHATQVVFRSSLYVGCADVEKTMSNGNKCFIQTCRYIAKGNCFYNGGNNWEADVLSANCGGPRCPIEGCF